MAKKSKALQVNNRVIFTVLLGLVGLFALLILVAPQLPIETVDALHLSGVVTFFTDVSSFVTDNLIMLLVIAAVVVLLYFVRKKK